MLRLHIYNDIGKLVLRKPDDRAPVVMHIYTAEGIGCHKLFWQSSGALSSLMPLMEQISATSYCLAAIPSNIMHAPEEMELGMTEDQLRLQGLPCGMLRFHEDPVFLMFGVIQRGNVQLRRNIMHDLSTHEGVSIDDGNGAAVAGFAHNINKAFNHSVVPPTLPHVVAAGATVAGSDFLPLLQRQCTVVAHC